VVAGRVEKLGGSARPAGPVANWAEQVSGWDWQATAGPVVKLGQAGRLVGAAGLCWHKVGGWGGGGGKVVVD
jgi:hypothetical protein